MGIRAWCRPSITSGRNRPPRTRPAKAPPVCSSQVAKLPMAAETSPATNIRPKRVARPATRTVRVGVRRLSRASGTQVRHHFSTWTASSAAASAPRTPPWPGERCWPNASIFTTPGKTTMAATAPPRTGVPPNSLAVLWPTKTAMRDMKPDAIAASAGTTAGSQPVFVSRPFRPAMMPQPIRAGIRGTKMFAMRRRASLTGVALRAFWAAFNVAPRAASSSAVTGCGAAAAAGVAAGGAARRASSTSASNSGVTRATVPGPSTIWYVSSSTMPSTAGTALRAWSSTSERSCRPMRSRVMQCAIELMLSGPPTRGRIAAAVARFLSVDMW